MGNKEYYILYRHDGEGGVDQYQTEYEGVEQVLLELSLHYIPVEGFKYIDVDEEDEEFHHIYVFMEDGVVEYSLILAKDEDKFINKGDF